VSLQEEVQKLMHTDVMETPEAQAVVEHDPETTELDDAAWQSFFSVQLAGIRSAIVRIATELDERASA
jgi:hypothetical protein